MKIGISGAGIGGLVAAIGLAERGIDVVVYEQADRFARVGADINLTPNAVKALDGLGISDALRETAARPTHRISRTWDTGAETSRIEMAEHSQERYGAPQLTMHRADLMTTLESTVSAESVRFGKKLTGATQGNDVVEAHFDDGSTDTVDVLVGADGIHSATRTAMFGPENPTFTGVVAFRSVVPVASLSAVENLDAFTKWWGPNPETQLVTFPLNKGEDMFIFATIGQDSWRDESWTQPGSVTELQELYADFHPEARAMLHACTDVLKSALYVRDPLPTWSEGRMVLLGDAAHPMMPFMAQGAGQSIEDAVVLTRCLDSAARNDADLNEALRSYEHARLDRTAGIQLASRQNEWLKDSTNPDEVYGYDAWNVALA